MCIRDRGDAATLMKVDDITDETSATFFHADDDGLSFGMIDETGMTFAQDTYIATFMLEKTNSDIENTFFLDTAQYTLYDADDLVTNQTPEKADYTLDEFVFGFADHSVALELENDRDVEEIPNKELMVTNLATNDGLSLVPVAKMGNMVKYQLVMNIPIPVFIQAADINPDHSIVIDGTIFDNSITWLTDLDTSSAQTLSLIHI